MTITNPFNVSVVAVTINNTFNRYYINGGYQQPNLTLFRGQSYTFNLNGTVAGSPFWIKTIASIGTGNAFNTGVTGNGSQSGTITFAVPNSAPDILYYGSQNNEEMWGQIFIFDGTPSDPTEATTTIVNPIFEGTNLPLTKTDFALMRGSGVWNLPCNAPSSTTYTGSSTGTPQTVAWRMNTNGTASSSALYRANPNQFIAFARGNSFAGVNFARPVWLIFSAQIGFFGSTGIFRIQLGGYDGGATTVGQMTPTNAAFSGLGFEISGGQIKLETINTPSGVATRNLSASLGTFPSQFAQFDRVDLKAYSDGLGNVKVWINNVLVNTLTIGPTAGTGNVVNQLRISVQNGTAGGDTFVDICQDQLSVIVE
jgi:hypothetical protein